MADFLLSFMRDFPISTKDHEVSEWISQNDQCQVTIYGNKDTFCFIRDNEDFIASIGYVCHTDSHSMRATLSTILNSFNESQIAGLKKTLVGQYVIMVKKADTIYLFSDFLGVRNIFYSNDGKIIATSFSKIEDLLGPSNQDLDINKVFEYLCMRHVHYPTWLGSSTLHKRIKWLLPSEYLVFDICNSSYRIGSITYSISNHKEENCSRLADELLSDLTAIINRKEFKGVRVAASLTGGRDSRLVAAIAADQYPNIRFRTAVSTHKYSSLKDFEIAQKIAQLRQIPIDAYEFQPGRDDARFIDLTEGFAPQFNHAIAPLIDSASNYALGLGGAFGTELFKPIVWNNLEDYLPQKIKNAKKSLRVDEKFWGYFRQSLYDDFMRTKQHFELNSEDERDYFRLFKLINTARYSSFTLAAFNRKGYQVEPYGSYTVVELALRIAPSLWGDHRKLVGDSLVQKAAMAKLAPRLARVLTYNSFRPMTPLTLTSFPMYLIGYAKHSADWLKSRYVEAGKQPHRVFLPGGYYVSNGWATPFLQRVAHKYGLEVKA